VEKYSREESPRFGKLRAGFLAQRTRKKWGTQLSVLLSTAAEIFGDVGVLQFGFAALQDDTRDRVKRKSPVRASARNGCPVDTLVPGLGKSIVRG
jgi:hypothetical protein